MNTKDSRNRTESWRLGDVVDFEYFQSLNSQEDANETAEKARHWFQSHHSKSVNAKPGEQPDSYTLTAWLEDRRSECFKSQASPGTLWVDFMSGFTWFTSLVGFLFGIGVTSGLLKYDGVQPINVAMFLAVLVIFQFAWTAVSFLFIAGKGGRLIPAQSGVALMIMRKLLQRMQGSLHRQYANRVSAETRLSWDAFLQSLSRDRSLTGRCLTWPIVHRIQWMGTLFNVGAIVTFVISVLFRDMAFGWQTSIQRISVAAVASWVKWVSLPWNWIWGEGQGYPSLEQIEGSRIILKDGIGSLQNPDLTAWWPFLLLSLICFGLIPRLALWCWCGWITRQHLKAYPEESAACRTLWGQFQTPYLNVSQAVFDPDTERPSTQEIPENIEPTTSESGHADTPGTKCWVMLDEDMAESSEQGSIEAFLQKHGWEVLGRSSMDANPMGETLPWDSQHTPHVLLWIQEGWQPPIQENVRQIVTCRKLLPTHMMLVIGLVGLPDGTNCFTPVQERHLEIWNRFISNQHQPGIRVEALVTA